MATLEPGFLQVLDVAVKTCAHDHSRYALTKVQLRGAKGEVIATDGRQVLVQSGLAFPWKEDVLVPALSVFGCKELAPDGPIALGKSDSHVCLRVGPWTLYLAIDKEGRFPSVELVLPTPSAIVTTCKFSAKDAALLVRALPRLPGGEDDSAPITLDVGPQILVRARAVDQGRVTEVVLNHTEVQGPPMRLACNRHFLARALQLGFRELSLARSEAPLVCRDGRRTYAWMALEKNAVLPPAVDALRIISPSEEPCPESPQPEKRMATMNKSESNGNGNGQAPIRPAPANGTAPEAHPSGAGALIAEAQALRDALHEACGRDGRLVAALKKQRRQSKLASTALANLKLLQQIDG
jgi:hypothetical protein